MLNDFRERVSDSLQLCLFVVVLFLHKMADESNGGTNGTFDPEDPDLQVRHLMEIFVLIL